MFSITITGNTLDELKENIAIYAAVYKTDGAEETAPKERKKRTTKVEEANTTEAEPEAKKLTYDDVKTATLELAKISRKTALSVLNKFRGVKLATDLKEEEWGAFIQEARAAAEAHKKEVIA